MERELRLRVTLVAPPPGVSLRVQRGKADLVAPTRDAAGEVSFDLTVRVGTNPKSGLPNFLGPFAQGPPISRFLYVNSGTSAGQAGSPWTRRAKVPLSGISWQQIEQALEAPGAALEARIAGTGRDGGPACATVPLLDGGWRLVEA